jgi:hypothetical protein
MTGVGPAPTRSPGSLARGDRYRTLALAAGFVLASVSAAPPMTAAAGDPIGLATGVVSTRRTEQPARLIPDQLPVNVVGGTIDTPLGPARWVHLSGDREGVPAAPMIGRDGLVWFYAGRPADQVGPADCAPIEPRLWTSSDAVSARVEHRLPVDTGYAFLTYDEGGYWLDDRGSEELWRSPDLADWEPIDGSELVPPDPVELPWEVELGWPVTSGGVSLIPVSYAVGDLGTFLGFPGSRVRLEAAGPGRYHVIEHRSRKADPNLATLLVERTASGIRLADESDATVAELTGVGPDFVEALAAGGLWDQLAIIDGSRLVPVEVPGLGSPNPESPGIALLPLVPGFLAFQRDVDTTVRIWRSTDGRSWIEGGRVPGPDGRPMRTQSLWAGTSGGRHEVSVSPVEGAEDGGPPAAWSSVDGGTWTAAPQPPAGISYPAVKLRPATSPGRTPTSGRPRSMARRGRRRPSSATSSPGPCPTVTGA